MSLHRIHLADCVPQPWRNGGGLTRELLRWPAGGDAESWQVRVSVAEITRDGPFSPFPGIERWFAVLEGAGVALALPGGERRVGCGDPPLAFPGEQAPACRLLDGPTRDLNLMLRRGRQRGTMIAAGPRDRLCGRTRWRALFAAAPVRLEIGGRVETLPAGTLAWSDATDAAGGADWRLVDAARTAGAYWMRLEA